MRIAIIGARGMIGSQVSKLAADRGHEVTLLSRKGMTISDTQSNLRFVQWDGKDAARLAEILEGLDAVVNLAGESIGKRRWTPARKEELLRSRLEPAAALVAALRQKRNTPLTLVQASAIGYYGTGETERDESAPDGKDYLADFARRWEESTAEVEAFGIRRIILRTGIVLKKGQGVLPQLMLPFQLLVGGPVGSGRQNYSWIHIHDEAEAILFLLENPSCKGVYNLTSPNPVSNSQMGRALAKNLHRPYWMPVPGFALKLVLGEMSTLVLDGQKVLPKRLLEAGYRFKFPELDSALKNLLEEQ